MSLSIKDIAKLSGVSTATVSRTLSHPDRVSEETRRQVMEVVERHGYRVNSVARNLRRQRSDSVLALVPDLGNPFFAAIFAGVQDRLSAAGLDLLVADSSAYRASGRSLLNHLKDARVDGLLCLDGNLPTPARQELAASDLGNRVVFACEWLPEGGFPSVRSDNREGMRLAVEYLVSQGHRRIAFLCGPAQNVLTIERLAGVRAALSAHGLALPDALVAGGDFSLQAGQEASAWFLRCDPRPTAVICASDQLAMGLMHGLQREGISVPRDLSLIGFDDIATAAYFTPDLTTIRQDRIGIGAKAAQVLLDQINGVPIDRNLTLTLPVTLQLRGSTGPVPTGS